MAKFNVRWTIELETEIEADDEKEAEDIVSDRDPKKGDYVVDSFELVEIEEIKPESEDEDKDEEENG